MLPKYNACALPLLASTIATPVFRSEASMARTRMDLMGDREKHKKNATDRATTQTYNPKASLPRQCRNRSDGDGDLKHGHAARKNFMLMEIRLGFRLFCFRFFLYFLFLFLLTRRFFTILLRRACLQPHFSRQPPPLYCFPLGIA